MENDKTLKLIQKDLHAIRSQIDILRMETRAHQLEPLAHLLDLAFQEAEKSQLPNYDVEETVFRPIVLQ